MGEKRIGRGRGVDLTEPATRDGTRSDRGVEPVLELGSTVGRYVVLDRIGRGGMGVVFSAYDPQLDRRVALKILLQESRGGDDDARLFREARAIAQLTHPNVVVVHDVGTVGGHVFIAMEFVRGRTLHEWARSRPWQQVVEVMIQAAQGLFAAHQAGIIHGDFKPSNVLVDESGRARVLDFGLARPDPESAAHGSWRDSADVEGDAGGTPAYMAPEHFAGDVIGPSADQYAFCVTLFEVLSGHRPYEGTSWQEIAASVSSRRLVATNVQSVPRSVARVMARGLAADPRDRYPDLRRVVDALRRTLSPPRWWKAARFASVAAIAVAAVLVSDQGQLCSGAREEAATQWNPERRRAVQTAFERAAPELSAGAGDSTLHSLDGFIEGWVRERTAACEATRLRQEVSETLMDAQMACLDARLATFSRLVDDFERADRALVAESNEMVGWLIPPSRCSLLADARLRGPTLEDPEARARVSQWLGTIEQAEAFRDAGRSDRALESLSAIADEVRAFGHRSTWGRLLAVRGDARYDRGDYPGAAADLEESFDAAVAGSDDGLAYTSARSLVYVYGLNAEGEEKARWWLARARAYELRTEPSVEDKLALINNHAVVAATHGHPAEALREFRRGAELSRREHNSVMFGDFTANVAALHGNHEEYVEARAALEDGLAVLRGWGESDSEPAVKLERALAIIRLARQDYLGAWRELERLREAGAIRDIDEGPVQQARGVSLMYLNDLPGALEALSRADAWFSERQGESSRNAVVARVSLARTQWLLGDLDGAWATASRVVEGDVSPRHRIEAHVTLGFIAMQWGHREVARRQAEEAVRGAESSTEGLLPGIWASALLLQGHAALDDRDEPAARRALERARPHVDLLADTLTFVRPEFDFLQARLEVAAEPRRFPPSLGLALARAVGGGPSMAATRGRIEAWMARQWPVRALP